MLIRSPEAGMFVGAGMLVLGVWATVKLSYARWRARHWEASQADRDYWRQMGLMTIWVVGGLFMLLAYFKDYCQKTRTCSFPYPYHSSESCTALHSDSMRCLGLPDDATPTADPRFPADP
jgi:hypothetical protein